MKCEKCGINTATTHIKSIVNGVLREIHLCPVCASKQGYGDISNMNFAGMLASMFGDNLQISNGFNDKKCPQCNQTFSQIAKSGKVGCAECYNVFTDDIKGILKGFGVTRSYTGSLPNQIANFTSSLNDRVALQEKLNKAIQEENYEKAAVYRDKLKMLENQSIEEASE